MKYTSRFNINRGYVKLDIWKEAIELLRFTHQLLKDRRIDFKLKSQLFDSIQSISSNIAEGYGRRTIGEYLQFLNFSLGSSAESLSRMIGLFVTEVITESELHEWDLRHYSMENKLLGLIRGIEAKRKDGSWGQTLPPPAQY